MEEFLLHAVDTLRGIWHRRWTALAVAWVIGAIGLVAAARFPQYYEASTRVYVDTQTLLKPLLNGLAIRADDAQQVNALSRTLVTQANVAKVLEITHYQADDLAGAPESEKERLLEGVARRLSITSVGQNNLYTLSFRDADPEQAKRVVGALLSVFVDSTMVDKRTDSEQARRFIEEQIKTYETKLQEAEDRVKEFKLKHMGVLGGDGKDYYNKMVALGQQRDQARMDLRAAEEGRDAIKRELAGEDPVFLSDPVQSSAAAADGGDQAGVIPELDVRIDALRKTLDELLRRFTDQHPDVLGTRRVLAELEQQRSKEIERRRKAAGAAAAASAASGKPAAVMGPVERNPVYQRLKVSLADAEAEAAQARARYSVIDREFQDLNSAARMVPQVEAEYVQLTRDYDIQKKNYEALVARRETAAISSNADQAGASIFRIVDPPRTSQYPVAPNRALVIVFVLLASLGGGIFVSFVWAQIQPVFHEARALRKFTARPLLGTLSMLPDRATIRRARRKNYAFAAALVCLIVGLAAAAFITAASSRIA